MKKSFAVVMSSVCALNAVGLMTNSQAQEVNNVDEYSGNTLNSSIYPTKQMKVDPTEFLKDESNYNGENVIKDDNLRFMINSRYNVGENNRYKKNITEKELMNMPVTKQMVENLIMLSPEQCKPHDANETNFKIKSLEGMEYATNLEWLSLVYQEVDSLEPLRNSTKLKYLDIRANTGIKSLDPLANAKELAGIDMHGIKIKDISVFKGLKNLTNINANACDIQNIEPLSDLTKLIRLDLGGNNAIDDLTPLSKLNNLKYLDVSKNNLGSVYTDNKKEGIKTVEPLKDLVNLVELNLSSNDISDIKPLENLKNLKHLIITNNRIKDFSPIESLKIPTVWKQNQKVDTTVSTNPQTGNDGYDKNKSDKTQSGKDQVGKGQSDKTQSGKDQLDETQGGKDQLGKESDTENKDDSSILKQVSGVKSYEDKVIHSRDEIKSLLPEKTTIKVIKKKNSVKPEGIYDRATLRIKILNQYNEPIEDNVKVDLVDENNKVAYTNTSKGGYVDLKLNGNHRTLKLVIDNKDYTLKDALKVRENQCNRGFHMDWIEKNENKLELDPFIPENKTKYDIKKDDMGNFVVNVAEKEVLGSIETDKSTIKYVIKDEKGKLIKKPLEFTITEKDGSRDTIKLTSKDGILEWKTGGSTSTYEINLVSGNDDYKLKNYYSFSTNYSTKGAVFTELKYGKDLYNNTFIKLKDGEIEEKDKEKVKDALTIVLANESPVVDEEIVPETARIVNATPNFANSILSLAVMPEANTPSSEKNIIVAETPSANPKPHTAIDENEDKNSEDATVEEIEVPVKWEFNPLKSSSQHKLVYDGKLQLDENIGNVEGYYPTMSFVLEEKEASKTDDKETSKTDNKDTGSKSETKKDSTGKSSKRSRGTKTYGGNTTESKTDDIVLNTKIDSQIFGSNREQTSVELSKAYYKNADTVIIANGHNYADALVASPLSKAYNAPILLVNKDKMTEEVKNEISRLNAKNIIVMGGENTISQDLLKQLDGLNVTRLGGSNRYETSKLVYDKLNKEGKSSNKAILTSGEKYYDALSSANLTAKDVTPILLTSNIGLNKDIENISNSLQTVYVVGGEKSVSNNVVSGIKSSVKRIAGKDRYETSVLAAKEGFVNNGDSFVVSGENYSDALSVGGVISKANKSLVLTPEKKMNNSVKNYLSGMNKITIVGGEKTIDRSIFNK